MTEAVEASDSTRTCQPFLVPRRRVDIDSRLDRLRILKVSHLTTPDVQIDHRTVRWECGHQKDVPSLLFLHRIEPQVCSVVLGRIAVDVEPAGPDGKLTGDSVESVRHL